MSYTEKSEIAFDKIESREILLDCLNNLSGNLDGAKSVAKDKMMEMIDKGDLVG
ncbi:hypothetical protein [Brassicibacter mesophilus]|uniref:hypothetical protein n=1 Tax=Brassicibacter mesophilus TaxID=745119 RepID=UPI003D19569A